MAPSQVFSSDKIIRKKPKPQFAVLGVIPEKQIFAKEMLSSFSAQFWGQAMETPHTIQGIVSSAPGEPSPVPLTSPSGLSRIQFLIASQALGIPCFPNYCKKQGGLVVDRVLLKAGGEDWWTSLAGRIKAQNLLAAYQDSRLGTALKSPANYSMCSTSKFSLGRTTTLRCSAELDGEGLDTLASSPGSPAATSLLAPRPAPPPALSATASLRRKLASGAADLKAELGINQRLLASGIGYSTIPVQASLDVGSSAASPASLQYRVGVHQAAAFEGPGRFVSRTHLQGGAALQGERTLWKAAKMKAPVAAAPAKAALRQPLGAGQPAASPSLQQQQQRMVVAAPQGGSAGSSSAGAASSAPRAKAIGPHNPLRQSLRKVLGSLAHAGGAAGEEGADKGQLNGRGGSAGGREDARGASAKGGGGSVLRLEPEQIQEVLLDGSHSLNRLREDVNGITSWVGSGALAQALEGGRFLGMPGGAQAKGRKQAHAAGDAAPVSRRPGWSAVLPPAHFKIGGLLGLLARVPLGSHGGGDGVRQQKSVGGPDDVRDAEAGVADPLSQVVRGSEPATPASGQYMQGRSLRNHMRNSLNRVTQSRLAQQGAALRPFASGGVLCQLGSFQRSFFDFTRVMLKADLGLVSPRQYSGPDSALQRPGHPAFSLEGCGAWHALTLSCCQQLAGPVRLCADLRFALDSTHALGTVPTSGGVRRLAAHVASMRPSLLEATYGLDVALPMTSGLARVAAWYSPNRKEAMVELRLF